MRRTRAQLFIAIIAVGTACAIAPVASGQIAALDKGHQLLVNSGLQIWGCDTGASSFTYSNLTGANMNAVMWSFGQSNPNLLSAGQKWGKWVSVVDGGGTYLHPNTALNATEIAHISDLISLQVGDEQQVDIEDPNGKTKQWFIDARAANLYTDKLLYVNSFFIGSDTAYATFIANANPDAISFDAYPFGSIIPPYNWLGKAQQFRRHALGSYITPGGTSPRPYGLYLQMYNSVSEEARDPGDLEMRWQQFTAWTLGYTFVDNFTVGGSTSMFIGGSMANPNQPRYNQFKESARQSMNLGPALTKLISYSNGAAGGGTSIVRGRDPSGALNAVPVSWQDFNVNDAPPSQRYLTGVSAVNLGTKNNGQPGDVYVGFFNPLLTSYGDPAGTTYFMITNALGAYLQDPTLLVTDCIQRITLDFNFGSSGINSLKRLRRSDGQVEVVPLSHLTGNQYRLIFDLEGGTGDLFKYNDGTPFVGIEQPTSLLYWDNDGVAAGNNTATGLGLGGSGNWDAGSSKWFNGSTNGVWVPNQNAVFWGTAGTVTLTSPQAAGSVNFKTNGYTLTGSTLTMNGSEIGVDASVAATINSVVAGSVGINKTGTGTLVLSNAGNTYSGGTTIGAGVLRVSSDGALGAVPGALASNITLNSGTLQFGANFDLSNNRGIDLGAAGGTIDTQGFTNPSGYTQHNGIQGAGNLTKVGSGTFYMNTAAGQLNNNWTGNLILKEGTWKITERGGLPYNANQDNVYRSGQVTFDGGTLQTAASISVSSIYRGMTVAAGGGTFDTQGFNFGWGGPLIGTSTTATLTKIGSGTLTFTLSTSAATGPSTYAGKVQVNGGGLALSGGAAMGDQAAITLANTAGVSMSVSGAADETIGSLAGGGTTGGSVVLNASLNTGGNNTSTTYSGTISGAGGLTKSGAGTMTLTGANSYSGGTTVSGGTLRVNNASGSGTGSGAVNVTGGVLGGTGTISGPITVGNGGHLAPGNSPGTLFTSSSTTLSTGAVLDYELANVTTVGGGINDLLSITGGLTLGSSLTLNINAYQGDLANGTYTLMTYSGGLAGNISGWSIGSSTASGAHGYSFSTATPGEIQLIVAAATPTWTGAISANWDTGGNWQMGVEPNGSHNVVFPTPIPATGGMITLTSGEVVRTLTVNDNYTFNNGDITVGLGTISVASDKTLTINSVLKHPPGGTGIVKTGAGTLVLTGTNAYANGTHINGGTVSVQSDANLSTSGDGVTFGGGTLNVTASFSTARVVTVNSGGGAIDCGAGVTTTLTGTVSGAAGNTFTKTGGGTLVLNQATPRSGLSSSWLGNIAVSVGTVKVGNGGSTGFLPGYDPIAYAGLPPTVPTISLAVGATLEFSHAGAGPTQNTTNAVVISGAGNVVISGTKTEVFVANNTYTGSTTINSGSSLRIGWGGVLNTGGLGATAIANSGSLTFSNDHNTTFPGSISGTGTLLKEFSGTLTLTGGSTFSGGTTVANGTLLVNNSTGSGSGSGPVVVNSSAVLGGTGTIAGVVTINSGGHIAPGASIESLDVGSLTLAAGSILGFELDTVLGVDQSDLINVTTAGGLAINGGTLNITNAANMTGGIYTLIDYTGTLNGSLSNIVLGATPGGYTYSLTNNILNQSIEIEVTAPGDFNHDGTVDGGDYVVWRKGLGTKYSPTDYDTWRANYGQTYPTGGGASLGAVPEPAAWILSVFSGFVLISGFGRLKR